MSKLHPMTKYEILSLNTKERQDLIDELNAMSEQDILLEKYNILISSANTSFSRSLPNVLKNDSFEITLLSLLKTYLPKSIAIPESKVDIRIREVTPPKTRYRKPTIFFAIDYYYQNTRYISLEFENSFAHNYGDIPFSLLSSIFTSTEKKIIGEEIRPSKVLVDLPNIMNCDPECLSYVLSGMSIWSNLVRKQIALQMFKYLKDQAINDEIPTHMVDNILRYKNIIHKWIYVEYEGMLLSVQGKNLALKQSGDIYKIIRGRSEIYDRRIVYSNLLK